MYALGEGVPKDDAEAARLYRLAAEQGEAGAQFILGRMYSNGDGVPEDDVEAVRWWRLAAEQGHASAQTNLGRTYVLGKACRWTMCLPICGTILRRPKELRGRGNGAFPLVG